MARGVVMNRCGAAVEMLTAVWSVDQNPNSDNPKELFWASGKPASMADFRLHELDTHVILQKSPGLLVKQMRPDLLGEVKFDEAMGSWALRCAGFPTIKLDVSNPNATDGELCSEIYTQLVVFRAVIVRS